MPFLMIKGSFFARGYSPDGDSTRFAADDPGLWRHLEGRRVRPNRRGHVRLRLEGIDALETHFSARGSIGDTHQPLALADAATDLALTPHGALPDRGHVAAEAIPELR